MRYNPGCMRNERSISIAAIVVMLCCMGSVVGAYPHTNSNAHIASVIVHTHQSDIDRQVSEKLDAPERTSSCFFDVDVPDQIEIEEFQNLPPPVTTV
jgi:hypothetical protein